MKLSKEIKTNKFIYLKPGAFYFKKSNDFLQIAFPNYTTNFQTTDVVDVLSALLDILPKQPNVNKLILYITKSKKASKEFVEYIIEQLVTNNCAIYSSKEIIQSGQTDLSLFYTSIFNKPDALEQLKKLKFLLLTPKDKITQCKKTFELFGLNPIIIAASPASNLKAFKEEIYTHVDSSINLIASWNFPYKLPTANMINSVSIEKKIPVLFGVCKGIIGKIGPFIIPKNSPCLECMHSRIYCNLDENEAKSYALFRTLDENKLPASWISHPGFHTSMLNLFAIEINKILLGLTPNTLGAFVEFSFGQLNSSKHNFIKVPNCPVCFSGKPARFAWDYQFPAPVVKNGE